MTTVVAAQPYPWPWHGTLEPAHCALVVCRDPRWRTGGPAADAADRVLAVLAGALSAAGGHVVMVEPAFAGPGTGVHRAGPGPVITGSVVQAPATSGFYGSALHEVLRRLGARDLLVAGWGLEGPVHSTLRAANDQGYECLLVPDASVAVDPDLVAAACSTVVMSGGIFGAHAPAAAVLATLGVGPVPTTLDEPVISGPAAESPFPDPVPYEQEISMSEQASSRPVLVEADPYPWPFDGALDPARTALVLIDWQVDFCGPGGYVDRMGYDLALTRAGLEPTARVLEWARSWGCTVVHTREGHRPDLADCPDNKLWRSKRIGAGIGDAGPCGRILVRGEPGWEIVPEVAPVPGERVVDKPGKGAFYATDLGLLLENRGITHLIFTGITTDVCVHTTMRDANDRGYECLLLADCTGATDEANYRAALKMVTMQGGVFGAVAQSTSLMAAFEQVAGRAG